MAGTTTPNIDGGGVTALTTATLTAGDDLYEWTIDIYQDTLKESLEFFPVSLEFVAGSVPSTTTLDHPAFGSTATVFIQDRSGKYFDLITPVERIVRRVCLTGYLRIARA